MLHERLQKGDTLVIEDTSDNPVPAQVRTVQPRLTQSADTKSTSTQSGFVGASTSSRL